MQQTKTRHGVFETNSSSTHAVHLGDPDAVLVKDPFPRLPVDAPVEIYSDEYGWEIESYFDIGSKLSYLYTDAMLGAEWYDSDVKIDPNDQDYQETNEKLKMLVAAVKQHTGRDCVFHRESDRYHPFGYIDHQSVGELSEVWENVDTLINWIFNPTSGFETDNDNH